ncbi:MAG: peptidoglycan DD-metalloendopeptidase family protein [Candidatus Cloacimonetes bacterium]|nr:peptidoglycan DD-metalloendopeptidase family protein [Candidatus Cloacimonadota bacterium]
MRIKIAIIIVIGLVILMSVIVLTRKRGQKVLEIADVVEEVDPFIYKSGAIKSGQTLVQMLREMEIESREINQLVAQLSRIYNLRRLQPADSIAVKLDTLRIVHELSLYPDKINIYRVIRDSTGGYFPKKDLVELIKKEKYISGNITSSLYKAMIELGEYPELIMEFTQIFQWDIDFFCDTREGDKFTILYEVYTRKDGSFAKYGNIMVAEYKSNSYHDIAYMFCDADGRNRYYDENGESFQKTFLRSPLNYKRISSHFSTGRLHPILKTVRPHDGVDYAAPYGTPVEASADGIVIHAGWLDGHSPVNGRKGGYGKTVKIKHNNGYETLYGHLSSFAENLYVGKKVSQRDVIGYVGSTGLSTGDHLHYSIYQHGAALDPLKLNNVAGKAILPEMKNQFNEEIARYKERVNLLTGLDKPINVTE